MALFLTFLGRVAFFGLIITQSVFLSTYLAKYEGKSNWYFAALSFGPAVLAWILLLYLKWLYLGWVVRMWSLYLIALVLNIAMVVAIVGDRISKTEFLSPNVLKAILCITPLLLLLLLNTGDLDDSHETYKETEIVSKLYLPMTVDLFDGVEMIDIVLEAREYDLGIPKAFSTAMFVLACISFLVLVSPWHMLETRVTDKGPKRRFRTSLYHNIVQIVFVNVPFLVFRARVSFMSGKDQSIFIAKNGIGIVLSILEIHNLIRDRHRVRPGDQGQQRDQGQQGGDQAQQGDQGQQRDQGHQEDQEQQGDQGDQ